MTSAGSSIDTQLAQHGLMNFTESGTVAAGNARLSMNASAVFLTIDGGDGGAEVVSAPFRDVSSATADRDEIRTVDIAGTSYAFMFTSTHSAQRFDRVLGVRKESGAPARPSVPTARSTYAAPISGGYQPQVRVVGTQYHANASYALAASILLLVLGWIDLIGGFILTIVFWANGGAADGFIMLFAALAGCAVPLGLGCLIRAIIFRHRMLDAANAS